MAHNPNHRAQTRLTIVEISPITLIDRGFDEEKAQSCDNADL
jgi:hypothetical protein